MEAHEATVGQRHIGGPDDVDGAATAVGVQPDATAGEPAGERGPEVGRIDGKGEVPAGELAVDGAKARPGAHDADVGVGAHVDAVETREVERQAAVAGHGAAERRRGGATDRHRDALVARPAQRLRHLGRDRGQKDEVREGVREGARERAAEVDVLVLVRLGAQRRVGDDALGQRRRMPLVRRAEPLQTLVQRRRQSDRPRRPFAIGRGTPVVEEPVEVGGKVGGRPRIVGTGGEGRPYRRAEGRVVEPGDHARRRSRRCSVGERTVVSSSSASAQEQRGPARGRPHR